MCEKKKCGDAPSRRPTATRLAAARILFEKRDVLFWFEDEYIPPRCFYLSAYPSACPPALCPYVLPPPPPLPSFAL